VTIDLRRVSAFAVFVIALAGYVFVFRPLETTAGDLYVQIDAARATLERSTAMARRIPALELERSALAAQLARLHTGDRRAATVDRFLRGVAGIAAQDGVAVEGVAAGVGQPLATSASATPPLVEEIPFDLTLRGPYGDVIRAVRDLNGRDGAVHISVASLSNAERRPGGIPQLNAAFHVLLLREAQEPPQHDLRPR
jgi:1-acyl-sn-glycerol-3-phosphate acyltransferase